MTRMKIKYMSALLAAATLSAVASAGVKPAEAAIVVDSITPATTYSALGGTAISNLGSRLIDFNNGAYPGTVFGGTNQQVTFTGGGVVSGSVGSQYAAPAADANGDTVNTGVDKDKDNTPYFSLGGSGQSSPVTLKFKYPIISNFGFLWGSIDSYNTISFLKGDNLIQSFTGSNISDPANGRQDASGTAYVNFLASADSYFDTVKFESTSPAFEFDDVRYTEVPTPALLPGLVGIGVAALRKRKKAGEAQEA